MSSKLMAVAFLFCAARIGNHALRPLDWRFSKAKRFPQLGIAAMFDTAAVS
jgi:hypothetical protein